MTQVSKIKLRPEVEARIYELLSGTLVRFKNKKELVEFLDDFISPTEKIILAKRIAIAVLLAKGNNYVKIANILRVTPGTINKMSLSMKYGNGSVKKASERIAYSDFGDAVIEEILGLFENKRKTLTGENYLKPILEKRQKVHRLKKEI